MPYISAPMIGRRSPIRSVLRGTPLLSREITHEMNETPPMRQSLSSWGDVTVSPEDEDGDERVAGNDRRRSAGADTLDTPVDERPSEHGASETGRKNRRDRPRRETEVGVVPDN